MFDRNPYEYSSLSTKSDRDIADVESAFDFSSIYSYNDTGYNWDEASGRKDDKVTVETVSGKLIGYIMLGLSYVVVFFSLPISVWYCFKILPQCERLVIYRLGKLLGVKGPGTVFTIPWLDYCSKLDLRTQLIQHPVKQFLSKDKSIVEAGCNIHYRICDPAKYVSNVRDPELKGLKLLVHAITFKKMENCNVKEMGLGKKVFIEDLALKELNTVTAPWGLEISSVEIVHFRMLQEAEPVNGVLSVIRQLGVGAGPDGDASPNVLADMLPKAALNLAAKGLESFASGSSDISPPLSQNSSKLQELVNSLVGKWDMEFVTCFKIDQNEVIYVDVMERSGVVYETNCPKEPDVIVTLSRNLFESFITQRSSSHLLRAYLEGQITVEGDSKAIKQFQRLLTAITDG